MAAGDVETNISSIDARKGALFNGVDTVVTVTDATDIQDIETYSISAWAYSQNGGQDTIGRISSKGAGNVGMEIFITTTTIRVREDWVTTDGQWDTNSGSFSKNAWHHVVVTYDRGSTTNNPIIYIDGVSVNVNTLSTPAGAKVTNVGSNFKIGDGARNWQGGIHDMHLYNVTLTQAEVTQLYTTSVSPTRGLVSRWKLEDDYTDSVGANDGTNTNTYLGLFDAKIAGDIATDRVTSGDIFLLARSAGDQVTSSIIEEL